MILNPFYEALSLDKAKNLADSMQSREIFLAAGRVAGGLIIITGTLLFKSILLPSILVVAIGMAYPLILSKRKIYRHSEAIEEYPVDGQSYAFARSRDYGYYYSAPENAQMHPNYSHTSFLARLSKFLSHLKHGSEPASVGPLSNTHIVITYPWYYGETNGGIQNYQRI